MKILNREDYLTKASNIILAGLFVKAGYKLPEKLRLTCGLPSKGAFGAKLRTIGQCWSPEVSSDDTIEIMISPTVDDNQMMLGVLVHELVHAVVGNKEGHGKVFKQCAIAVGLTGKMTATTSTDTLIDYLQTNVIAVLGDYPHAKIDYTKQKKQTTRMIKCECESCGYVVRTSRKWVEIALPICGVCSETMQIV